MKTINDYIQSDRQTILDRLERLGLNLSICHISESGLVDVRGDVIINIKHLTKLGVHFRKVDGDFDIRGCKLTTLEGCPETVTGDFHCNNCHEIISLTGSPDFVGGSFNCCNCRKLRSLKGGPIKVDGDFYHSVKQVKNSAINNWTQVGKRIICV